MEMLKMFKITCLCLIFLNLFSKLFEKVMTNRLTEYFEMNSSFLIMTKSWYYIRLTK